MAIIYHADDFGITADQSKRILERTAISKNGALNSTSILVTGPHFDECADLLDQPMAQGLKVGLHLNLVEGPCAARPADVPLLVDDHGIFRLSFAGMLSTSLGGERHELERQLGIEIGAQLDVFLARFPQMRGALRLDSHQHFHLIPAVFRALLAAMEQRGCTLEYLRIPAEPALPFLQTPSLWLKIPAINWIKHWLLDFLWRFDKKLLPDYRTVSAVFCGICFSGHMTIDRVSPALPAFERYAQKRGMDLELLFHPGGYEDASCALNPALEGFTEFYTSPLRCAEADTLYWLKEKRTNQQTN